MSSFAQHPNGGQTNDVLSYIWHDPVTSKYSNMLPEDCYIEMYMKNGKLIGVFFWDTTDEFDEGREGYTCGYFVLPMTEIIHEEIL